MSALDEDTTPNRYGIDPPPRRRSTDHVGAFIIVVLVLAVVFAVLAHLAVPR